MTSNRDRRNAVYRHAVKSNFAFLKATTSLDDLWTKSIALKAAQGFLLPVCELHASGEGLISEFAQWRIENAAAFPSQFPVTLEGTKAWLRANVLDVEDRMLFLVLDRLGQHIGHIGLACAINERAEVEIDNVVRGVKGSRSGLMRAALLALLDWTQEILAPESICLRVFDDNAHAISFYHRLGFKDDVLLPLRRVQKGEAVEYGPRAADDSAPPDKSFLRMFYNPAPAEQGVELILTAGPTVSARETSYALDAARYGWNKQWSGYLKRFEKAFAEYVGAPHALNTSSCTGALHLALAALDLGPGDEVIVPDLTWVATANAVVYVGATPIFADVEPESWCLDSDCFESRVTERTKAVMPVHLYGHPARMDRIMEIARRHKLWVVEDAAPSIGTEFRGQKTGTFGDLAAFSFQGAKLAVTGEGGMLVVNNPELMTRVESVWDQGRDPERTFWIRETGLKYKMSNLQAAFGLAQLERVDEMIEAKRRIFSWYAEGLSALPHLTLNLECPWARSTYWMTSILLDERAGITRDGLRAALRSRNVDTRPAFPAISQYPIWQHGQPIQPVALRIGAQALNLPSGVRLKRQQVDYICRCVGESMAA
jgi:perosamine synthetase